MFGVVDDVEDGLVEAVNELVDIFAYMVVEPSSLHDQPYPLNRNEIG